MADFKKLQAMAKNGEISEELMKDEEFKKGLKKVLKEELGVEITDSEIPEMLKELEKNLGGEKEDNQVLSEENLESVSGGVSKALAIKRISMIVGEAIGAWSGYKAGGAFFKHQQNSERYRSAQEKSKIVKDESGKEYIKTENESDARMLARYSIGNKDKFTVGSGVAGAAAGAGVGLWIGNKICEKFNIK